MRWKSSKTWVSGKSNKSSFKNDYTERNEASPITSWVKSPISSMLWWKVSDEYKIGQTNLFWFRGLSVTGWQKWPVFYFCLRKAILTCLNSSLTLKSCFKIKNWIHFIYGELDISKYFFFSLTSFIGSFWWFQCRLLRIINTSIAYFIFVKTKQAHGEILGE